MRLTSRLAAGLVVGLDSLSPSSRRQLAKAFCEQRSFHVTDEVLDWLARSPTGGARPILGDIIVCIGLAGFTLRRSTWRR